MVDQAIANKFIDMLKKLGVSDATCELVEQELMGENPKAETPEEEKSEDIPTTPKAMGVEVIKVEKQLPAPGASLNDAKSSLLKRMMA